MNRAAIKEAAMKRGECRAEFVDQLCGNCADRGTCRYVPVREATRQRVRYAACGIKEVRLRRWWPAYELGVYRWIWQARFICWLHRQLSPNCGETWIEER